MDQKTPRLLIAVIWLALMTSATLVLIDYRLKHDLLAMFYKIEQKIDEGNKLFRSHPDISTDPSGLRGDAVVPDIAPMETPADTSSPIADSQAPGPGANGDATVRRGRTRRPPIQESN